VWVIESIRALMSLTACPIDANASRARSTVATPLCVWAALCDTAAAAWPADHLANAAVMRAIAA
jgi:hypothetical protein